MNKEIDVWEIAKSIEEYHVPQVREEIEEYVNSKNGKIGTQEILELMGIGSRINKEFTIKLIQDTIDQLHKDK